MRTFLRIAAVLLALLAAAAAVATVIIKVKFPPDKIKALAAAQVKEHLRRELWLGEASVGLWSGLSLRQVALSEKPGFSAGTFLSADRVSVEPFLLALLKGRVVVKRVSLDRPAVS